MTKEWVPPLTCEERLKKYLCPPSVYIRMLYHRSMRQGEAELHLVPYLCHGDKISLDIGANKGIYSYAMLRHSKSVEAFEPNPKMHDVLHSWAKGQSSIRTHTVALSNGDGQAELIIPSLRRGRFSNQGASLDMPKTEMDYKTITVQRRTVDSYDFKDVGFIKIDVEGHELTVLEGAQQTLARERPNLLLEIEEKHLGEDITSVIDNICQQYHYQCCVLQDRQLRLVEGVNLKDYCRDMMDRKRYIYNYIFLPLDK